MSPEKADKRKFIRSSGICRVPLELYIHVPFCVKKCDYCDFLSAPADEETQQAYFDALAAEIRAWGERLRELAYQPEVVSVFIGGGTPSVPDAGQIARVMREVNAHFLLAPDAEISMEANPGTLTGEKLRIYRSCGINRLSLGLQSSDNRELALLGRIHTWEEFLSSFRLAREAGFSNMNVDLMSAIPGQSRESWQKSLRRVAELSPEHISAYSLIIEEGTPFASRKLALPDEDTEYQMYEDTAEILREYGFAQYEISNYAKPGFACRHNLGYWKRSAYLGLGLGASSFRRMLTEEGEEPGVFFRYSNTSELSEYLRDSASPERLRREAEVISRREAMEEFLFLGLRMSAGISEEEYERQFGEPITRRYGGFLKKYESSGHLHKYTADPSAGAGKKKPETFWRFTRKGIHVSNRILADVLD